LRSGRIKYHAQGLRVRAEVMGEVDQRRLFPLGEIDSEPGQDHGRVVVEFKVARRILSQSL